MKNIIEIITEIVEEVFVKAGYETEYGKVTFSNRQDLCQFQCNGAMVAAKAYKEAPFVIGSKVADILKSMSDIYEVAVIKPGFININLTNSYISDYLGEMNQAEKLGFQLKGLPKKVVVDYGGPNIAKPLHVGHLRSAVIGESIKRINKFVGNTVVGDIHLGDWGLQIGIVIEELRIRKPDLVYFDDQYKGEYPKEAPFTISELSEIYPIGSKKSKEEPDFMKKAQQATAALQDGNPGFQHVWQHINKVSVDDLKSNYGKPFKTRDGGVMKLEDLIHMLKSTVEEKVLKDKSTYTADELTEIPIGVGLAALKYGDLINQASKDYIFDLEKFTKFEGKTGPYIQYSIVRIKSILKKAGVFEQNLMEANSKTEENISIKLLEFHSIVAMAYKEKMPSKICEYAFDLSNLFNRFYHETYILSEENEAQKVSRLTLLLLLEKTLETCLEMLGISVLGKM